MKFIENETYTGIIATETPLEKAEYVDCVFENCDFSNAFLNNYEFEECQFINCNFSLCNVANTSFRTVQFEGCKMMGVNFTKIKDFLCSMHFTNCNLNFALFTDLPVKGLIFEHCNLQQADFSQADITGSSFVETDLNQAVFDQTNLTKVDFRSATNFSVDPTQNTLNQARFSKDNILGLVQHLKIKID